MAYSKMTFLPVDNGNMVLIKLNDSNKTTILYDMYIREKACDENDDSYDVLGYLKNNLNKDEEGRLFVDVFILSHHDDDHIRGFQNHFHTGDIKEYIKDSDKIYIKEIWGSSRFFKRADKYNTLEANAKAFNTEMKRRYKLHKDNKVIQEEGNRIIILGESEDDKTDHVQDIVYKIGDTIKKLNNKDISSKIEIELLGPIEQQDGEAEDLYKRKNRGSVVLQLNIKEGNYTNQILLTGDSGADVLEYMHEIYPLSSFEYDILQAPHHCSKYSMYNQIGQGENKICELSETAFEILSQAKTGAKIIASCREFGNETPPHNEAKEKYEEIVEISNFLYTAGHKKKGKVEPIELEFTQEGHKEPVGLTKSKTAAATIGSAGEARGHG
ncbi:hypothetical protein [Arcobacter sp. F2176]|uniref:hypothetical protein n=1 Tax=Arcobacter sp. F2176 TaxID=2044511 RepID=UPI00100BF625|nr:hypothetical protein [Arcobacter sp. F2176]RXJ79339.1 hypothetical protein CRU95_14470 [Arcobacter sp. F2176]